jgi:hypothetical protein
MRAVAAIAGIVLVLTTWHSVLRTVFIPRYHTSCAARWTVRLTVAAVSGAARLLPPTRRESLLGLAAPLALFLIAGCWLVGVLPGFALLGWGLAGMTGSAHGLADFFTLRPASGAGAAAFLLGGLAWLSTALLLAAFTTHLGRVTDAYSRRERAVTKLAAQAARPPDAEIVTADYLRTGSLEHLGTMLGQWAEWMADIESTHQGYPALVYYRQAGRLCWIKAAVIMLDCAALVQACASDWAPPDTGALLAVGCRSIQGIAGQLGIDLPQVPMSFHGRETSLFATAVARVQAAGLPMRVSEESANAEFHRLRTEYAPYASALAERLHCDLAPAERATPRGNDHDS